MLTLRTIDPKKDIEALLLIEDTSFQKGVASDAEDLERQARKGIGYLAFSDEEPVGYIIALPLEKVQYRGCTEDEHKGKNDTAYIESVAVREGSPMALLRLCRKLMKELSQQKIERITMHVESGLELYKMLLRLGGKELQQFDNWMGWNKTFSYVEFPVR